MKKRLVSLVAVFTLLLAPVVSIDALTVTLPEQGAAANLAEASTLTLSHTAVDKYPNAVATYNADTDSITMTGINYGRSTARTDAPAAIDGMNYVLSFSTKTKGWSNTWSIIVRFAEKNGLWQGVSICDKYVGYTDAGGTLHQLAGTTTNGAQSTVTVYVREEANNNCGVYIYLNGTLKGEFHKQQDLVPTFAIYGAEGAQSWQPVVSNIKLYATADKYGDVNGDGSISAQDVTALSRYLANWDGYTAEDIHLGNADMDQDGSVTPLDEVALNRYFANWTGYEAPYIPTIVVTDRGVDNTGATDVTDKLTALHATGKRIYYPDGTYLFNGETLDLTGGVEFESQDGVLVRNSISDVNILNFDDAGNLIGLMQNHLQDTCSGKNDATFVKSGSLVSPPVSDAVNNTKVEFLPFWYNDFGLYTRYATSSGSITWYDWSWNHTDPSTNRASLKFEHQTGTANESTFAISGITMYKPTGSNVTSTAGATNYAASPSLSVSDSNYEKGTWASSVLNLTYAATGSFYQSTLKYGNDSYAVQFTVAAPDDANATLAVTTKRLEKLVITNTGVTYNGTALTFAQSGLSTTSAVTYTMYFELNNDKTRTVTIYANGQAMKQSSGATASFNSSIADVVYDAARHPLLGYYFGDDSTVLDWQSYWLREYGVDQAALVGSNIASDPSSESYWIYQLLNSPNGKQMDFALWLSSSSYSATEEEIRTSWWATFDAFYFNSAYKNQVYCYEIDGEQYPVVWLWDESATRYSLSTTSTAPLVTLYQDVATAFKDAGYPGVCILARTPALTSATSSLATLDAAGVKWMAIDYNGNGLGSGSTYGDKIANFTNLTNTNKLYGVATGLFSHGPHTSYWNTPGTTPALFGSWLQKAVAATTADTSRAQIVTCYNVSEWAEGGPGLIPTVADRFGYLEAIRDNILN